MGINGDALPDLLLNHRLSFGKSLRAPPKTANVPKAVAKTMANSLHWRQIVDVAVVVVVVVVVVVWNVVLIFGRGADDVLVSVVVASVGN